MAMTGWIGITLGDVTGIGSEVALKALAADVAADTRYLLLGDEAHLRRLNDQLRLELPLRTYRDANQRDRLCIHNPGAGSLPASLPAGSPAAASAALVWLEDGARRCLRTELDALVTAPVNKEAILRTGKAFVGQTEFLSQVAGTDGTAMMLLGEDD